MVDITRKWKYCANRYRDKEKQHYCAFYIAQIIYYAELLISHFARTLSVVNLHVSVYIFS